MEKKEAIVREVRILEFYSRHIWPIHRRLVRKHLTPRCRRCILPETYAPLVDGLCPHCREPQDLSTTTGAPEQDRTRMQAQFEEIINEVIQDRDRRYHAMLLFSGGKDSSYMLHRLMTNYPDLRILAVTVDNTFMSPVAMENIQEIIRRLGVDHMVIRPKAATMEKMFRYAFLHLNDKGCSGTVDQFDGDFFSDMARNLAAEMNIPYIICGLSSSQVENILGLNTFITDPADEAKAREEVAGIRLADVFDEKEMKYWWNGPAWPAEKRPRMIFPLYIWDLEEEYIKSEVLRLGLMPRGDESPLITNHRLIPLMGIVDMLQFGYSSFEPEFAGMIRQGKAERKHWFYMFEIFEYAARTGRFLGSAVDEALARLSLSRADVGLAGGKQKALSNSDRTIPGVLAHRVSATPDDIAFMEKDASGRWLGTTWRTFDTLVTDLACRLAALGLGPGDQVGLLIPNSLRWEIVQHAALRLGAEVIGLDRNDPAERMAAIFEACTPKILFVDTVENLNCIPRGGLTAVRLFICNQNNGSVESNADILAFDDLPPGRDPAMLPAVSADQTATMIFTSGTTGKPKALSFTHGQLVLAMDAITSLLETLPPQARTACWLPLANPFQRIVNLCAVMDNWRVFMVADPTTIISQVGDIAPHLFAAVPRFYEKLHEAVQQRTDSLPMGLAAVARWAQRIGRHYRAARKSDGRIPWSLRWRHAIADRFVLRRLRAIMGPHIQYLVSGSAPASPALIDAFSALGFDFLEAYGVSENIIPMAINPPRNARPGSVGRPLAGNTVRISKDQEVMIQSPGLARETASRLVDGYLPTGDLGRMDEDGYLYLFGRKGDMLKLSTGRKVQPGPIEEAITRIDDVVFCVAAGTSRKYVVTLVNIREQQWLERIRANGNPEQARIHLRQQVHENCSHLPAYCRPVDVTVVTTPFSPQTGELTVNLKLRRKAVLEKYADTIDALYDDANGNVRKIPVRFKKAPVQPSNQGSEQKRAGY